MSDIRVGLVLSGGGAKGAYQVGVVKAISEVGAQIDAIAGASIGALNGAILAAAPSIKVGALRLEEVWNALAESSPLSLKTPSYLELLAVSGLSLNGLQVINGIANQAKQYFGGKLPGIFDDWLQVTNHLDNGMMSDTPLRKLMDRYLCPDALSTGLPLYVSVFRSKGAVKDILSCISGELGFSDSPDSEFLHIQSLEKAEQREAMLASAAIPLLFSPKKVNNTIYSDGGQGGWSKMQGNTPITPLLEKGYGMVIVTHLSDGSLWSRHDFPEATVLEIRPQTTINREGGVKDLLGFDVQKIPSWIQQGYDDAMHCLGRVMKATHARTELRTSERALAEAENRLLPTEEKLAQALERLR